MNIRKTWENLPTYLKEIVCLQRSPSRLDSLELIARGLARYRPNGTLTYTKDGYDVRFYGFQQNRRGN